MTSPVRNIPISPFFGKSRAEKIAIREERRQQISQAKSQQRKSPVCSKCSGDAPLNTRTPQTAQASSPRNPSRRSVSAEAEKYCMDEMRVALGKLKSNDWTRSSGSLPRLADLNDGQATRAHLSALAAALTKEGPHHDSLRNSVATELKSVADPKVPEVELRTVKSNLAVYGKVLQEMVWSGQMSIDHMDFNAWSLLDSKVEEALKQKPDAILGSANSRSTTPQATKTRARSTATGRPTESGRKLAALNEHNIPNFLEKMSRALGGRGRNSSSGSPEKFRYIEDNRVALTQYVLTARKSASQLPPQDSTLESLLKGMTMHDAEELLRRANRSNILAAANEPEKNAASNVKAHLDALGRKASSVKVPSDGHCMFHALAYAEGQRVSFEWPVDLTHVQTMRDQVWDAYDGLSESTKALVLTENSHFDLTKLEDLEANLMDRNGIGLDRAYGGVGGGTEIFAGPEEATLYAMHAQRPVVVIYGDGSRICFPDGHREVVRDAAALEQLKNGLRNAIVITNTSGSHFEATEPLTASKP